MAEKTTFYPISTRIILLFLIGFFNFSLSNFENCDKKSIKNFLKENGLILDNQKCLNENKEIFDFSTICLIKCENQNLIPSSNFVICNNKWYFGSKILNFYRNFDICEQKKCQIENISDKFAVLENSAICRFDNNIQFNCLNASEELIYEKYSICRSKCYFKTLYEITHKKEMYLKKLLQNEYLAICSKKEYFFANNAKKAVKIRCFEGKWHFLDEENENNENKNFEKINSEFFNCVEHEKFCDLSNLPQIIKFDRNFKSLAEGKNLKANCYLEKNIEFEINCFENKIEYFFNGERFDDIFSICNYCEMNKINSLPSNMTFIESKCLIQNKFKTGEICSLACIDSESEILENAYFECFKGEWLFKNTNYASEIPFEKIYCRNKNADFENFQNGAKNIDFKNLIIDEVETDVGGEENSKNDKEGIFNGGDVNIGDNVNNDYINKNGDNINEINMEENNVVEVNNLDKNGELKNENEIKENEINEKWYNETLNNGKTVKNDVKTLSQCGRDKIPQFLTFLNNYKAFYQGQIYTAKCKNLNKKIDLICSDNEWKYLDFREINIYKIKTFCTGCEKQALFSFLDSRNQKIQKSYCDVTNDTFETGCALEIYCENEGENFSISDEPFLEIFCQEGKWIYHSNSWFSVDHYLDSPYLICSKNEKQFCHLNYFKKYFETENLQARYEIDDEIEIVCLGDESRRKFLFYCSQDGWIFVTKQIISPEIMSNLCNIELETDCKITDIKPAFEEKNLAKKYIEDCIKGFNLDQWGDCIVN